MVRLKTPIDVVAILAQLSGALAWPILQWTNNSKAEATMDYAWALPLGLILASLGRVTVFLKMYFWIALLNFQML